MRLFILLSFFVFSFYQSYSQTDDYKEIKKLIKSGYHDQALDLINENLESDNQDFEKTFKFLFNIQNSGEGTVKNLELDYKLFKKYYSTFNKADSLSKSKVTSKHSDELLNLYYIAQKFWVKELKAENYKQVKKRASETLKIFQLTEPNNKSNTRQKSGLLNQSAITNQRQVERIDREIAFNNKLIESNKQIDDLISSQSPSLNNSQSNKFNDQTFSLKQENNNLNFQKDRIRSGMSSTGMLTSYPRSNNIGYTTIEVSPYKIIKTAIVKQLRLTAQLALKNKDTLNAINYYKIAFPIRSLGSKANVLLLNNEENEAEYLYYLKTIAARMRKQTVKELSEFCNLVDKEKLKSIDKMYNENKKHYPIVKGVLNLYLDDLDTAELVFQIIIRAEEVDSKIYESLGYVYFTYGRKRASKNILTKEQLKTVFEKSKEYYTKANTPKAKRGIEICNTMLNML